MRERCARYAEAGRKVAGADENGTQAGDAGNRLDVVDARFAFHFDGYQRFAIDCRHPLRRVGHLEIRQCAEVQESAAAVGAYSEDATTTPFLRGW